MAITTLDGYIGAAKQKISWQKASATSVAGQWHTTFNLAGTPGAGSFGNLNAVANASLNGRVCDDTTAGFPSIWSYGTNNTGYMTKFAYCNSVTGRFMVYDRLWEAGPFLMINNRVVPLTVDASSYAYRLPLNSLGQPAWERCEIWVDVSTTLSASASTLSVRYVSDTSTIGTTPATATLSGFITGRTFQLPLQAGDRGAQKIIDISIGGATNAAGVFNVYLCRTLYEQAPIVLANLGDVHSFEKIGMPTINASSCIAVNFAAVSTATGVMDAVIEIVNG